MLFPGRSDFTVAAALEDELSLEEALQLSLALEESERTAKEEAEARRLLYVRAFSLLPFVARHTMCRLL